MLFVIRETLAPDLEGTRNIRRPSAIAVGTQLAPSWLLNQQHRRPRTDDAITQVQLSPECDESDFDDPADYTLVDIPVFTDIDL